MALNIKNAEVERLVSEVAELAGESKTEAVRRALEERRQRLAFRVRPEQRADSFRRYLAEEVWPRLPKRSRLTKAEREAILGYGPDGA